MKVIKSKKDIREEIKASGIFDIDKTRLDEEWERQPKLYFDFAARYADAKKRLDTLKRKLSVVSAELSLNIRNNPKKYKIPKAIKLTETLVNQTIERQKEYQLICKKMAMARHRVDILQGTLTALEQRKSSLERLVSLHGQSYFATPRPIDEKSREVIGDMEKKKARKKKAKKND